MALIPNIASWASGLMDNALAAAGTSAAKVGDEALANAGVVYNGTCCSAGARSSPGLVLGAIVAFIIDKKFIAAAAYAWRAHARLRRADPRREVGWNADGQVALGYLFAGAGALGSTGSVKLCAALDEGGVRRGRSRWRVELAAPEPRALVTRSDTVLDGASYGMTLSQRGGGRGLRCP